MCNLFLSIFFNKRAASVFNTEALSWGSSRRTFSPQWLDVALCNLLFERKGCCNPGLSIRILCRQQSSALVCSSVKWKKNNHKNLYLYVLWYRCYHESPLSKMYSKNMKYIQYTMSYFMLKWGDLRRVSECHRSVNPREEEESLRVINRDLSSSNRIKVRMKMFKLHIRKHFLVMY